MPSIPNSDRESHDSLVHAAEAQVANPERALAGVIGSVFATVLAECLFVPDRVLPPTIVATLLVAGIGVWFFCKATATRMDV